MIIVSPDLGVDLDRGNIVLRTPERVITVTDVDTLISALKAERNRRDLGESRRPGLSSR